MEKTAAIEKRYFSVKEVSNYTSIASSTLYEWASNGVIPSIKIGRKVLFDINDVDRHLESLKRTTNILEEKRNKLIGQLDG